MSRIALIFLVLISCATLAVAQQKKRFVLYAMLVESTPVQLADGFRWQMDKGDTFPVVMYKEQQTKIVLQLGGTSFMVNAQQVKVVEEKDLTAAQLATYRTNVAHYLESRSEKMKAELAK